jgi:hypothetical protein
MSYSNRSLPSKQAFFTTLFVATLTIAGVWFIGLRQDWSLFKESLVVLSILSVSFLGFLTVGLFNGVKLRDNLGQLTRHIKRFPFPKFDSGLDVPSGGGGHGEHAGGCGDTLEGVFSWLLIALVAIVLLWVFAAVVWVVLLVFAAMLYWVFFRALRFVFRHSAECRGQLGKSLLYGVVYTVVYNSWIYGIILGVHYLR